MEVAIPRVPSSKLKPLSRLVEKSGYSYFSLYTDRALDLHELPVPRPRHSRGTEQVP